jgi:hypothetical protein
MESQRELALTVAQQQQFINQQAAALAATIKLLVHERELSDELRYEAAELHNTLDALNRLLEHGH